MGMSIRRSDVDKIADYLLAITEICAEYDLVKCNTAELINDKVSELVDCIGQYAPLTRDEVRRYLISEGTYYPPRAWVDGFLNPKSRPEQYVECVRNSYSLSDFDSWQHIQDVLFGDGRDTIKFETAISISTALWEEGIDTLDLRL